MPAATLWKLVSKDVYVCRDLMDESARSLLLPGQPGQEVKGIVPAAQWRAVVGILMDLTDASGFKELPEGTCPACQASPSTDIQSHTPELTRLLSVCCLTC